MLHRVTAEEFMAILLAQIRTLRKQCRTLPSAKAEKFVSPFQKEKES
jgi:hypothetical protein